MNKATDTGWEIEVHCSRGKRTLRAGMQWRDGLYGSLWEVVEPEGGRIYSPSGFGGTPTFWCRPVGNLPEPSWHWLQSARDDGCISFCGDSIAAGLVAGDGSGQNQVSSMDADRGGERSDGVPSSDEPSDTERLRMVLHAFGQREDNMPLTPSERDVLYAFSARGEFTDSMRLRVIDSAIRAARSDGGAADEAHNGGEPSAAEGKAAP